MFEISSKTTKECGFGIDLRLKENTKAKLTKKPNSDNQIQIQVTKLNCLEKADATGVNLPLLLSDGPTPINRSVLYASPLVTAALFYDVTLFAEELWAGLSPSCVSGT